jgi:tRNA nucleotidyltransferase (CCA-adding enzyme)
MLLALTHDLGKIVTTETINGRIHSYEHETKGLPLVEAFVSRITGERNIIDYVLNMVPLHMRPNVAAYSKPRIKSTNRMFDAAAAPEDLIYFAMADKPVISGTDPFSGDSGFLFERLRIYEDMMAKPHVMGRDLIEAGLEPGEYFSELLAYAHKLRLAGVDKENAMKQVLAYNRKARK